MVDEIKKEVDLNNPDKLRVKLEQVENRELPPSIDSLTKKVNAAWKEILYWVETVSLVPINPVELETIAKWITDKQARKKKSGTAFHPDYESWINLPELPEIKKETIVDSDALAKRASGKIREFLMDHPHIPGYSFTNQGNIIGCMFLLDNKEHIFLHSELASHPIASWEFIRHMKNKHQKLQKNLKKE